MEQSRLHAFEAQCTQEEPPACQTMCPLHVEVKAVIRPLAGGKFAEARKLLDRTMPLSGLLGRLCEGHCMPHCRRADVDEAVNMPLLERACVSLTAAAKPMSLPANGKKTAILGAGMSGLTVAFELAKKGYAVTVFHTGRPGGRMLCVPAERLPEQALPEALAMLEAMRVCFKTVQDFSPSLYEELLAEGGAVYLGLDDPALDAEKLGVDPGAGGTNIDPLTMGTEHPRIFAGGLPGKQAAFILEAADGKRAAGSIDRILKGVSPATARDKEGVYASTLHTDVSGVAETPAVRPASPFAPTAEEAALEAGRCIQCECLECVKRCAYLAHYKGYPKRYAREIYNNLSVVHGQRRANTQINSCAECGLCAAVCPFDADMGAFCEDARREMVHSNRMPPRPHEFALQDMEFSNAPDVAFFRHQPGREKSARAFFPGCQLPASMPMQTEAVYRYLCDRLEGGVGLFFSCCGAPARWTGRPRLTADVAAAIREKWIAAGKPELILACSSCVFFFEAELPDIPARPLWDVLAGLPLPDGASPSRELTLALHDPCVTRKKTVTQGNVRTILQKLGQSIEELGLGRDLTRCCGYGGLAAFADPQVGALYAQSRADDTDNILLSYCIMCRDRLRSVGGRSLHLLDVLFPQNSGQQGSWEAPSPSGGAVSVEDYLQKAAERPAPGISSRQENRLAFRQYLLHKLWGEKPERNPRMDAIVLHISDQVAQKMEARRILRSDVKQVLLHAGDHGGQFFNASTGHTLACLRPRQVTFWVEFSREADGSIAIHDAYCHRMVVPGVPGEGAPSPCTLEGYSAKGGRM